MSLKHTIRHRSGGIVVVTLTPSKAIKCFCTECLGWAEEHPKNCQDIFCPLYPFRGKSEAAIRGPKNTYTGH